MGNARLVVSINEGSASASATVAGAMQRAIIEASFLGQSHMVEVSVQTITPSDYNASQNSVSQAQKKRF